MGTRAGLSDALLRGPAGLVLALVVFCGLALASLGDDTFLHDEGLLTHLFAWVTARDPAAGLFLQKSRPPISALYAPFAGSLDGFFVAHTLVGAVGVAALWLAARASDHRAPLVAALVLALSPLYIGGSVAGLSNTDVVAGLCIFAWLYVSDRHVAAAVVLGMLPWIRAEVAVLVPIVAVAAAQERHWRVLAALPAFGAMYGVAGIAYHHDPIWFLHYPPALPEPMPGNPFWASHSGAASLSDIVTTAVALTPLLPALGLMRWSSLGRLERIGLVFVASFALALVVLPQWRVFNFDQSPRYLLPVVPFAALALSRAVGPWVDREGPPGRFSLLVLAALAGAALAGAMDGRHPTGLAAVGWTALALALHRAGHARAALGTLGLLAALGPFAFGDGGRIDRRSTAPHLDPMIDRLAETVGDKRKVVYTNEPLLASALQRSGRLPNVTVLYIVQEDQRFELERLANPHVGQREALWAAMEGNAYGRPIRPDALRPDAVPVGAVFALTKDERLPMVLPPEVWDELLEVVHPGYGMRIAVRVDGGAS
ncbi:MAG: hypothetical protein AAGA54_21425 [Myxococcota bacterium]